MAPTVPEVRVVERWACSRVVHPIVEFQQATLDLRDDESFELHHTHTTPEWGWMTWLQGRWTRADGVVTLMPETALRRAWIGDGHRHQHGEDVPYEQWEEVVLTTPWRLRPRIDPHYGRALDISEVFTSVYPAPAAGEPSPCDEGLPPRRSRPASR